MKILSLQELRGLEDEGKYKAAVKFEESDIPEYCSLRKDIKEGIIPELKRPLDGESVEARLGPIVTQMESNIATAKALLKELAQIILTDDPGRYEGEKEEKTNV